MIRKKYKHGWLGYAFILPSILGFLLFVVYPLICSAYFSLTDWRGIGPKWHFVGFENFVTMFTDDPSFYQSIWATFQYVLLTVPTGLAASLGLSVLLNKPTRLMRFLRTTMYIPVIIPSIAALAVWKFAFKPDFGLINQLLGLVGLPGSQWLESETTVLPSLAIVAIWGGIGSTILIFLSGLQSVPKDVYEAAEIDGASRTRVFWGITFPLITPVVFLQLITGFINAFQQFNAPAILTQYSGKGGGPNNASFLLSYSIYYNAWASQAFGYAMSQVWVLFFIVMALTIVVYRSSSTFVYYEAENK